MNRLALALALSATLALGSCVSEAAYMPMPEPPDQLRDLTASVYLIGDAGLANASQSAVLAHVRDNLRARVDTHPGAPVLVVFLGDNIYDLGAREAFREEDLAKLTPQIEAVIDAPGVRGVFVPGNHDWGKGADGSAGQRAVEVQEGWIDEVSGTRNVGFLPADGCPGPSVVHLAGDVYTLVLDTEWLLRRPEDAACGTADDFYERLRSELAALAGKRIVLAAHHPMATGGPHGGNVPWYRNGPFVYYLAVKSGLNVQDLSSGRYSEMLDRLRDAILASGADPLAFAAGHDHSLQVIRMTGPGSPRYQLVSGSAAKRSDAGSIDGTRYATSRHGYMRLDFTDSQSRIVVYAWEEGGPAGAVRAVFSCILDDENDDAPCAEAPRRGGRR